MTEFDYIGRLSRAQTEMAHRDVDCLLASLGSELPYLTGYEAMPLERLTMAVIPREGEALLVIPELEAPRIAPKPDVFTIVPWAETDDPIAIVSAHLAMTRTVMIGDRTWSGFLLALQERSPNVTFTSARPLSEALRITKEESEIELLRRAAASADTVAAMLGRHRFVGKSESEVSAEVARMLEANGTDVTNFAIVASGPNGASPHHEPGDRVIAVGDAIVIDFGGSVGGYSSDTTRMFHVGTPSAKYREVHDVVQAAQEAAVSAVAPGVTAESVDEAARKVITDAGYGDFFIHRTGHGIGLDVHEDPYIVAGNDQILEPGMAFSIEPGVYLPGEFGVRIEDIVVCTEDGVERLNKSPRAVVVVS